MSFFTDDTPADIVVALDEEILDGAETATANVHAPGQMPTAATATLNSAEETVTVTWPSGVELTQSGIGRISIRLTYPGSTRTVAVERFVVEDLDGWYTLYEMRADWEQAPDSDAKAYELLTLAREQCLEYEPLKDTEPVPSRHRQAQLMQARNIWNSSRVDPASGGVDGESFVITPHPLDWMIKQILRPQRGELITGTETENE